MRPALTPPTAQLQAFTHLPLDIRGDTEEQGPVEGELDHVVPVLGRDDALEWKTGLRDFAEQQPQGAHCSKHTPARDSRPTQPMDGSGT